MESPRVTGRPRGRGGPPPRSPSGQERSRRWPAKRAAAQGPLCPHGEVLAHQATRAQGAKANACLPARDSAVALYIHAFETEGVNQAWVGQVLAPESRLGHGPPRD